MNTMSVVFFGSTDDSVLVMSRLYAIRSSLFTLHISAVVTKPPRPVGRDKTVTPTPVEAWAKEHNIPVLSFAGNPEKPWEFADESAVTNALSTFKADLLVSASYGQKIPADSIHNAPLGGLNVHPSLLPRWRGADPVPWAILSGDRQTGVSVVTLSQDFDKGTVLAQKKVPVTDKDFADPLRTKLFEMGAELLGDIISTLSSRALPSGHGDLSSMIKSALSKTPRNDIPLPYARKFKREDGFLPWNLVQDAINGGHWDDTTIKQYTNIPIVEAYKKSGRNDLPDTPIAITLERMYRALHPWPGVWTRVTKTAKTTADESNAYKLTHSQIDQLTQALVGKRLKILGLHTEKQEHHTVLVPDRVQLEGKKPVGWEIFQKAYFMIAQT